MPRRTNDFQRLVKLIEGQLASAEAMVRESVLLTDAEGDSREIDVLIEATIGHHDVVIGVECRDHKRKADKTWIEQLIGKYNGLPVHKVVAVSRSGFYAPALEKAKRHDITALTLEEARDEDWLNAVYGHKQAYVTTIRFLPVHVDIIADCPPDKKPEPESSHSCVYNSQGEQVGPVPEYFFHLLHVRFEATKLLMEPLIDAYDSKSESFAGGAQVASLEVPISSVLYLDPECQHPVTSWKYSFGCKVERSSVDMERYSYNGAQIATGQANAFGAQLLMAVVSSQSSEPKVALSINRAVPDGKQQRLDAYSHSIPGEGPLHYLVFAFG